VAPITTMSAAIRAMTDLLVQVSAFVQCLRFAQRWLTCGMRQKRGRRMYAPRRLIGGHSTPKTGQWSPGFQAL
jgi:hypothetical protein